MTEQQQPAVALVNSPVPYLGNWILLCLQASELSCDRSSNAPLLAHSVFFNHTMKIKLGSCEQVIRVVIQQMAAVSSHLMGQQNTGAVSAVYFKSIRIIPQNYDLNCSPKSRFLVD